MSVSVSDVGLSRIGETNVTSVNVTQETQSPAIRRIYFKHHPADKNLIASLTKSQTKELSALLWVDSGHMPLFTEISDPARCARSHLVVSLIEEQTLYQCIRDQYQDQQSIFTLPWVAQICIKLVALFVFLCYPKMIGFHSKTFSGETEKETVWIKTEDFS